MLGRVDGDSDGDRLSWGLTVMRRESFERDRRGDREPKFELPHQSIVAMKHLPQRVILVKASKTTTFNEHTIPLILVNFFH
jgi:hypothetical protein